MRYDQLLIAIDLFKPEKIIELGTWNGHNAIRMITQAQKYHKNVQYFGYDLFEDATSDTDKFEFNVKSHNTEQSVYDKITKACPNALVALHKGNTRETLKTHIPKGDFCYIDGGHSIETIASDYEHTKHIPVIVFDDYYLPDHAGLCPDLAIVGCNKLISELQGATILPMVDPVSGGGFTALVLKV